LQIDVADFSGPPPAQGAGPHHLRRAISTSTVFKDIVDVDTKQVLFTLEHEVRSMQHPMYARPLVNRDPAQTAMN